MRGFGLWAAAVLLLCTLYAVAAAAKEIASPTVNIETDNAEIWKCSNVDQQTSSKLQSRGHVYKLQVLSSHGDAVYILSSSRNLTSLEQLGLSQCSLLANLRDMVARELKENSNTLQHTLGEWISSEVTEELFPDGNQQRLSSNVHTAAKRSAQSRECMLSGKCGSQEDTWFTEYHNDTGIYSWFEQLADYSPYVTVWKSIGRTHLERDIMAAHITDSSESAEHKIKVYFQCLLHSREWISGTICMYLARYFANPDSSNEILTKLLRKIEVIIVPIANPDGYHTTWVDYPKYRFWRKNVAPTSNPDCDGVDLNRNFNTHWSVEGSSEDPCSDEYHGEYAGSEREVQAITNYIMSNRPVSGAIDFHSYSQKILYPPAWAKKDAVNFESLDYVSQWMATAAGQSGEEYKVQSMHSVYLASGTFSDWILENARYSTQAQCTAISINVELRPPDRDDVEGYYTGFMVPTEQILPTCEEMQSAVVKFCQLIIDKMSLC